ncbi:hypothetical protein Tco_0231859 [Tanacetum coccineum]
MPSQPPSPPPPSRLPHHLHLHLVTINTIVTTSSLPSPSYTTTRVRVVLLNPKQGAFDYWHQQVVSLSQRLICVKSSLEDWHPQTASSDDVCAVKDYSLLSLMSISTVRPVRPVSTARPLASKITQSNSVIRPYHPRLDIVRPKASNSPIKRAVVNTGKGKLDTDLKKSRWVWRPKGNWENVVKPSARCEWRPINVLDNVSKDNASMILKRVDYIDVHGRSNLIVVLRIGKLQGIGEFSGVGFISTQQMGRIDIGDIDTDAEITLIDETQGRINDIVADEDITLIPKLIIKQLKM